VPFFACAQLSAYKGAQLYFKINWIVPGQRYTAQPLLTLWSAHNNHPSLRFEAGSSTADATVRSSTIHLNVGKTYEVSGWVRAENLTVKDLDRAPIASGAALTIESMPFDVHSASVGGN
jgi:hypothetical protein